MADKKYVVMDGNTAAAHSAYALTEVAAIYPITPSSPMAEKVDEWSAKGKKNLFGSTVNVIQMQSEAGAAGTCHGSLQAGALTTTFTSSQGLMLMIPAMYAMGGQFLPSVMHVASRVVTSNHHSIFGDHTDIMTCRTTGYAMLMSANPQECMDLSAVAHLSAISARYAFMHCFDGFRTSHEMQRIEALDYADIQKMVDYDALKAFRAQSLNPNHPSNRGNNVNPDIYFQCKEGANIKVAPVAATVQHYMDEINKITGRDYKLFNYYGAEDAEEVIVVMCSASEAVKETIDYLNAQGRKTGLVQIHLYRPFSVPDFAAAIPATCKKIAVLDRNKETGSVGEPVYLDVVTALNQAGRTDIKVVGGRYGLSSKDTTPAQFIAVYDNLAQENPKNNFTIGIVDDVTNTSLEVKEIELPHPGMVSCKLWGLGGDGTVGANKNAISTIGLVAGKYAQAYFAYDTMKSGGLTQSHLRFGDDPIRSTYNVNSADFVAVHAPTYVKKYDTTEDLKEGGTFLLNCPWSVDELETMLTGKMKRDLYNKKANFYIINAAEKAVEAGLPANRTNSILQSAFFALTKVIPIELAVEDMKKNNYNSYFKKAGQAIVDKNNKAVDIGLDAAIKVEIPESWANAEDTPIVVAANATPFVKDVVIPMDRQKGDKLPVSVFQKYGVLDGTWENGTSVISKRGVAAKVPAWNPETCIQCNRCSMCCPHAAIRPILLTDEEKANVPEGFVTAPAKGMPKDGPAYNFRMQVSPYDCLGCGVCLTACPQIEKGALTMVPFEEMKKEQELFDTVAMDEKYLKKDVISNKTVKSVQFAKPYFQFSSACGGCAETTYIKLLSQLFGDHMYAANAAGCSSAISGGAPILPYCKDTKGRGPAWEHSLFEDNAEFAFGFYQAQEAIRKELLIRLESMKEAGVCADAIAAFLETWDDKEKSDAITEALVAALEAAEQTEDVAYILENKEYLSKKSVWAIGGDGWAYDIGFGGIDHVMAQNCDVNLMVLDTEVYSNTGGQSSKSTPTGAVAKFAAGGKKIAKKDLGAILMSYGYVYVAQVAMGADQNQCLKAIREAEAYPGPSIVICYCPCLEQGIRSGMGNTQNEMKKAVECGYWHLYRFDPRRKAEGKNPFQLDSKEPDTDKILDYLKGENRYLSLKNNFPERADAMYAQNVEDAKARYAKYKKMAEE
ncbi:MAG: pyruvate:ferredoxin (flavodoxin) oxidoreductase [Lachnospiraceae bacterium]|nr:pyruvate:ferredoxin (flavodoxin) oxidoreductase [Lachnospiraceae bacterium]